MQVAALCGTSSSSVAELQVFSRWIEIKHDKPENKILPNLAHTLPRFPLSAYFSH